METKKTKLHADLALYPGQHPINTASLSSGVAHVTDQAAVQMNFIYNVELQSGRLHCMLKSSNLTTQLSDTAGLNVRFTSDFVLRAKTS